MRAGRLKIEGEKQMGDTENISGMGVNQTGKIGLRCRERKRQWDRHRQRHKAWEKQRWRQRGRGGGRLRAGK
jgi:hypothetical protein